VSFHFLNLFYSSFIFPKALLRSYKGRDTFNFTRPERADRSRSMLVVFFLFLEKGKGFHLNEFI
jgi:hypothetical protein